MRGGPSLAKAYFKYPNTYSNSVDIISYDLKGNIKQLTRRGKPADGSIGLFDKLTYRYDGTRFDRMVGLTKSAVAATGFLAVDGTEQSFSYNALGRLASQKTSAFPAFDTIYTVYFDEERAQNYGPVDGN